MAKVEVARPTPAGGWLALVASISRVARHRRLANLLWFIGPFFCLWLLWTVALTLYPVPMRVFPTPSAVWEAGLLLLREGTLIESVVASVFRVLVGSILGIGLGVPLGVAMGTNRYVAAYFTPIMRFSASLAGIAWIPLATLWFGYGFGAIVFIIFNAVFLPVVYNTILGVTSIPPNARHAALSLGANRRQMLIEVLIPGAMPNIVTGIRAGLGYAWRAVIAAEIIATSVGLGYLIFLARDFFRTDEIVLGMILIGVIWLVVDRAILAPLERRTIERWGMVRPAG